jgi:SAM-dependent methyltransferase
MDEATYILGHSPAEIRRLINQAAIFGTTTERLLQSAGIERGMRVLDLGCGAGDVSILAGKLVGESGLARHQMFALTRYDSVERAPGARPRPLICAGPSRTIA